MLMGIEQRMFFKLSHLRWHGTYKHFQVELSLSFLTTKICGSQDLTTKPSTFEANAILTFATTAVILS